MGTTGGCEEAAWLEGALCYCIASHLVLCGSVQLR
jgi:hypothetical protein